MNKQDIIKAIQENPKANVGQGENIFVPMTAEQHKARKASFIQGLKRNMFKLEQRARYSTI